ncbi:MAG: 6-carboxytetrahydropterin synthase QueD [Myxococcales bacterium]|nr:MAG: 6-carboxytetrahydropterin synthase QueD [Myxococcales bacterium]
MQTEIEKTFGFEAAHRLPEVGEHHKCFNLHGHSFRVTLRVRGPVDPRKGWIVDFAELRSAWQPLMDILDHHYLNDIEGLENPTSEVLAAWIAEHITIKGAKLHSVTIHETCTSAATVYL